MFWRQKEKQDKKDKKRQKGDEKDHTDKIHKKHKKDDKIHKKDKKHQKDSKSKKHKDRDELSPIRSPTRIAVSDLDGILSPFRQPSAEEEHRREVARDECVRVAAALGEALEKLEYQPHRVGQLICQLEAWRRAEKNTK